MHYVGAPGGAKDNCQYYASQYVGASAHYYVGFGGEIWQSVKDEDVAWHCGASNYNHPDCRNSNSIGIELCVRKKSTASMGATDKDWYFEDATIKASIELTKMLMQKYGIPASRVIRHYDVTGKTCPNPYVYNHTKHTWDAFKAGLTGQVTPPQPQEPTGAELYCVKTGAYKDKKLAISLQAVLKQKGFDTCVKEQDGYHKVQVGAFKVKSNASAMLRKLKSAGYEGFVSRSDVWQNFVGECTADGVNVRTGPSKGYAVLASYPSIYSGNRIDVLGKERDSTGGWVTINWTDILRAYTIDLYNERKLSLCLKEKNQDQDVPIPQNSNNRL